MLLYCMCVLLSTQTEEQKKMGRHGNEQHDLMIPIEVSVFLGDIVYGLYCYAN